METVYDLRLYVRTVRELQESGEHSRVVVMSTGPVVVTAGGAATLDGRPVKAQSYVNDFRAGYAAGARAFQRNDQIHSATAKRLYRRVGTAHGSYWIDGFCAAIDAGRGHVTHAAEIAAEVSR